MTRFFLLNLILCFSTILFAQLPEPPTGYEWQVNPEFTDEFNGTTLNKSIWHDRSPYWVNGRPPATFRASAVSVKDGKLQIKNQPLIPATEKYNIAGGAVASVSKNGFFGYYETRMKASGISMSSTFWMKNKPDRAGGCPFQQDELDIVEVVGMQKRGFDFNNILHSNTHIFQTNCEKEREVFSKGGKCKIVPSAKDAYHTYGCWWVDENTIKIYLDGVYQFTMTPKKPFNKPMYLHLVTETYHWEDPPTVEELKNDSINTTYYDYVRAYKLVPISKKTKAKKYNILFIESDDQSNQTVGAFGNPMMKTPNIDKLVKDGVSFNAAYNMGCWSPAVCIPSRTMLFYGKYLWDAQKITKQNAPSSLPEVLKQEGYTTYMTGKWHALGKKPAEIFDEVATIQRGQLKTYNQPNGHATDITSKEAVVYIENYQTDTPFFLYVSFNAPHVPRETQQQYYDLYPKEKMVLPPSVKEGPLNPNIAYNYTKAPLRKKTMQARVQQNNAMVSHMDDRIGDLLNALKKKGLYEETIIVFMSDHGISFGENGVAGKVCLYEPSVTAPLIIKAPTLPADSMIQDRVYLQDIYPTLLDLLDISQPDEVRFQSLLPLIEEKGNARNSIYLAMFEDQRGIIMDNKKLIVYPKTRTIEFYDLQEDPWETNKLNYLSSSKMPIKKLFRELISWQKSASDKVDLAKLFPEFVD